jgi:hypothetical protein
MHRSLLSAAVALAFAGLPPSAASAAPAKAGDRRAEATTQLPRGVRPLPLRHRADAGRAHASFSAKAASLVNVAKATDSITLNAADLSFSSASSPRRGRRGAERDGQSTNADAQTATFSFAVPLAPRHATAWPRLQRRDRHPGRRPVLARLPGTTASRQARAVHPVREFGCAPHDPVLGRAGLQGQLRARRDGPGRPDGRQ